MNTVLIVDDDLDLQKTLALILKNKVVNLHNIQNEHHPDIKTQIIFI